MFKWRRGNLALVQKKNYVIGISFFILLFFLFSAYFVLDFKNNKSLLVRSPSLPVVSQPGDLAFNQQIVDVTADKNDLSQFIKRVGEHVFLPTGKVAVATVIDVEALRKENPIFYQYAKKGDRVLMYPTQAILYDPVVNLVLDIAHFSLPVAATKQ